MSEGALPAPLERRAPAKINLGLSVLGRRADGYHDLHSLMLPLDVADELRLEPAEGLSLRVEGADLPVGEGNLVYRAARAYLRAAGEARGVALTLRKHLPLAAGLGGGSSDAASTLLGLARLYPAPVDLPALALSLGADVPFFLLGGAALAEGVGERLTPTEWPPLHAVLLNPGVEVRAADAYRWLGESGAFTPPLDLPALRGACERGEAPALINALQPGVVARHPEVARALALLGEAGLASPLMSGSGSTCFGLARSAAQATAAAAELSARAPGWWVRAASFQP